MFSPKAMLSPETFFSPKKYKFIDLGGWPYTRSNLVIVYYCPEAKIIVVGTVVSTHPGDSSLFLAST